MSRHTPSDDLVRILENESWERIAGRPGQFDIWRDPESGFEVLIPLDEIAEDYNNLLARAIAILRDRLPSLAFDSSAVAVVGPGSTRAAGQSFTVLVVGPSGVGKSTLIGSLDEIRPPRADAHNTATRASTEIRPEKASTTPQDLGHVELADNMDVHLVAAPAQRRFWEPRLLDRSVGVLMMIDTRHVEDSFELLDQVELRTRLPFVVVINRFPDTPDYSEKRIRDALDLLPQTPIVTCDARYPASASNALSALLVHINMFLRPLNV